MLLKNTRDGGAWRAPAARRDMVRAALTGGIATGKSYCLARFAAARRGDDRRRPARARDVVAPGTPGLAARRRTLRAGYPAPDGTLDRPALGRIVFADRTARADLEAIIHPEVYRRIGEWFANLPAGTRVAIADIPLLFETGQEHDFDRVIVARLRAGRAAPPADGRATV